MRTIPPAIRLAVLTSMALLALIAGVAAYRARGRPGPGPSDRPGPTAVTPRHSPAAEAGGIAFTEVLDSGVDFRYRNGEEAGALAILESLGGGVAIFDYDGDGRPDLFFPGGGRIVSQQGGTLTVEGLPGRLYRNEGRWRFRDATEDSGLSGSGRYSHGCAAGDFDNDGDPDLLVTSYQGVTLYRNEGGRFEDVTDPSGLAAPGWSTSAAWADIDGDGLLDLYVVRYVDWSPEHHPECRYRSSGEVDVCSPTAFAAQPDSLYRNRGDGTFEDISRAAGLVEGGKGLGVVAADLDGDRDIDLYVANDTTPNLLYRNRGDGTFEELGLLSGAALGAEGTATGSMGAVAADADGDSDLDLWVTNYEGEINELYRNDGGLQFVPIGLATGLGAASRPLVGWGTGLVDFDGDTTPEVFVANGHLMHRLPGTPRPQPPLMHRRTPGSSRFVPIGPATGPYFAGAHEGRGCAFGDLDLDGDPDAVVVHQNAPVALLRNDTTGPGRFLRLRLEGTQSNRSAVGATAVVTAGGRSQVRSLTVGGYLSQDEPRLLVGVGDASVADRVEVRWPSGTTDVHEGLATDSAWLLREGDPPEVDPLPAD